MKTYQINLDKQNYSQYHVIAYVNKQLCVILIDTGACCSHISRDLAIEIYEGENPITYVSYSGEEVSNSKLTSAEIVFCKELLIKLEISIDNRKHQEAKQVLLGIDFLENFNYEITKKELILNGTKIPRFDMYYKDIQSIIKHV